MRTYMRVHYLQHYYVNSGRSHDTYTLTIQNATRAQTKCNSMRHALRCYPRRNGVSSHLERCFATKVSSVRVSVVHNLSTNYWRYSHQKYELSIFVIVSLNLSILENLFIRSHFNVWYFAQIGQFFHRTNKLYIKVNVYKQIECEYFTHMNLYIIHI